MGWSSEHQACASFISTPLGHWHANEVFLIQNEYVHFWHSSFNVQGTATFFRRIRRQYPRWSPKHRQYTIPSSTPSYAPNTGVLMLETFSVWHDSYFNLWLIYRDTLAEKVPCLHFLAQSSRKDFICVSNSESFFREPVISRHSSGLQRVSSMSTGDTVCCLLIYTLAQNWL